MNSSKVDPVEAIKELTGGFGADLVIDAVGVAPTFKQAFEARDLAGRVVLVGVPAPGEMCIRDRCIPRCFHRGSDYAEPAG